MRLYAGLYPLGLWSDPCDVRCECGYLKRAAKCREAQRLAWQHDEAHQNGTVAKRLQQGALPLELRA